MHRVGHEATTRLCEAFEVPESHARSDQYFAKPDLCPTAANGNKVRSANIERFTKQCLLSEI